VPRRRVLRRFVGHEPSFERMCAQGRASRSPPVRQVGSPRRRRRRARSRWRCIRQALSRLIPQPRWPTTATTTAMQNTMQTMMSAIDILIPPARFFRLWLLDARSGGEAFSENQFSRGRVAVAGEGVAQTRPRCAGVAQKRRRCPNVIPPAATLDSAAPRRTPPAPGLLQGAGGGTRTPDTRIMIPLL
jgi:hypothetical protein